MPIAWVFSITKFAMEIVIMVATEVSANLFVYDLLSVDETFHIGNMDYKTLELTHGSPAWSLNDNRWLLLGW